MRNLLILNLIVWIQPFSCAACELLDSILVELTAYQAQLVRIGMPESQYKTFANLPELFRYNNSNDTIFLFEAFYDDGYYRMAMWRTSDTISYSFEYNTRRGVLEVRNLEQISKWDTVSIVKDRQEVPVDMRGIPWVSLTRIVICNNQGTFETIFYWDIPERWVQKRKRRRNIGEDILQ